MNDPRAKLPSASSYIITEACPGSENLIRSQPPETEEPDEQAERGTRIHAAWETGVTDDLAPDELEDYRESIEILKTAVSDWKCSLPEHLISEVKELREERLWLNDPDTLEPLMSGQFDRCYIAGDYAFVADLKSGWCKQLMRSEINRQLRVLSVLVWKNYGPTTIVAAFIKPKIWKNKVDAVLYTESDLAQSEGQIIHSLWRSSQPDAPRVPGSHCTYCRAKAICPEAGAYSLLPSVVIQAIETKDMAQEVALLSIEDRAAIQSRAGVILKILEEVKKSLKAETPEALARVGLAIGKGRKLDPITNTREAFRALLENNVSEDELWEALTFSKGEMVKAVMRSQGWAKAPTEGWLWDQVIKPFITEKQSEGSLERIG